MDEEDKIGLTLSYVGILVFTIIGIASATTIYSGESITIPLDFEIVNCSIINSTYDLEGLNLSWAKNNIIISTVPNYQSDNLTISCWVIKYGEVVEEHYSGGGGSCFYNKTFNWNCSEWGECIDGQQTRTCSKYNNCHNTYGKPYEIQNCSIVTIPPSNQTQPPPQEPTKPIRSWLVFLLIGVFVIIIIGLITIYIIIKRRRQELIIKELERRKKIENQKV